MSAAGASARAALILSRFRGLSPRPSPPFSVSPVTSTAAPRRGPRGVGSSSAVWCLASGVDGGGLADDFVSTAWEERRRRREYSALANVLCGVEPLDASVIGEGVSASAKDAMKQTISSMLGLLPSEQFHVAVGASRGPLHRLLVSSVITGYTLWNAEYRLSLMRNFDSSSISRDVALESGSIGRYDVEEMVDVDEYRQELPVPKSLEVLPPAALNYIQKLEKELANSEKELDTQREENRRMGCNKEDNNDLLDYLRSLEPAMVVELSRPSSAEVEEIIQQLVHNIHLKCFVDDSPKLLKDKDIRKHEFDSNFTEVYADQYDGLDTTRDYLAKLLFWCMLMGHHMRGLEYRLHLSFTVGLS